MPPAMECSTFAAWVWESVWAAGRGNTPDFRCKKCAAMYEVLLARLAARYGDPARSFTLVQPIGSFLGPRPNHVTNEAIAKYQEKLTFLRNLFNR